MVVRIHSLAPLRRDAVAKELEEAGDVRCIDCVELRAYRSVENCFV